MKRFQRTENNPVNYFRSKCASEYQKFPLLAYRTPFGLDVKFGYADLQSVWIINPRLVASGLQIPMNWGELFSE